jgi:hypothetical protein
MTLICSGVPDGTILEKSIQKMAHFFRPDNKKGGLRDFLRLAFALPAITLSLPNEKYF